MRAVDLLIIGGGPCFVALLSCCTRILPELSPPKKESDHALTIVVCDPYHPAPGVVWNDAMSTSYRCNALTQDIALPGYGGAPVRLMENMMTDSTSDVLGPEIPRASVGKNIKSLRTKLINILKRRVSVELDSNTVTQIVPDAGGWIVFTAWEPYRVKGVVDLTGSGFMGYPVTFDSRPATLQGIPSHAPVNVAGMGLGAMDVVHDITAGRGGKFYKLEGRLKYLPSGYEPSVALFSRTSFLRPPRSPCKKTYRKVEIPEQTIASFWNSSSTLEAMNHLGELCTVPIPEAIAHSEQRHDIAEQINKYASSDPKSMQLARDRVNQVVRYLSSSCSSMHSVQLEALSCFATAYTSGPPVSRYKEWEALLDAKILRFPENSGCTTQFNDERSWNIRAFVEPPHFTYVSPLLGKQDGQTLEVHKDTRAVQGFRNWWSGGRVSSRPLTGDLPSMSEVALWQRPIMNMTRDILTSVLSV